MLLRKIEISGFKSFANRTEFIIEDGITGVVGPNGSGKSNIADAIRWVLGEQNSRLLRGSKMEDVIFDGTESRPKKAYCEVSLVFDNEDRRIHSDYSEIVISRKMYRSGESEYRINDNIVRLKDVVDVFRDTGIGKEGYSIVGQGRIDEILASKPTTRRKVFEEAAGIMKFRTRKEEAERKLEKTDENLVRVEDILEELSEQMGPLAEQAEQTRRYLELFERQKVLDSSLYVANYERAQKRMARFAEEQAQIEEELRGEEQDFGVSAEELETLNQKLEEISQASGRLSEMDREASTQIERILGEQRLMEERQENLQREKERLQTEDAGRLETAARLSDQQTQLAAQQDSVRAELTRLDEALVQIDRRRREAEEQQSGRQHTLEELKARQMELMGQIAQKVSETSVLSVRLDNLADQRDSLSGRLHEANTQAKEADEALARARAALSEETRHKNETASAMNENNAALLEAQRREKDWEEKIAGAQKRYNDSVTQKTLLEEMKAEYEGYSDSIRNLMRAAKRSPYIRQMLRGTVAENIRVPAKYEKAIETLLGSALQNVIVENEYDAKEVIEFLRSGNLGRVTFLPLEALRVKHLSEQERAFLREPGVLGVASETIEFDKSVAAAVDFLLARTVLVDTMEHAIDLMRRADYAFRAVTLEGDILRPGGTISGGSTNSRQYGLLSRERNIKRLAEDIETIAKELRDLEKQRSTAASRTDDFREKGRVLMEQLRQREVDLAAGREKVASEERTAAQYRRAADDLRAEMDGFGNGAEELQLQIDAAKRDHAALETERRTLYQQLQQAQSEDEREQSDLSQIGQELNDARVARAEKAKEAEALADNLTRLAEEIVRITELSKGQQEQLDEWNARWTETESRKEELARQLEIWREKQAQTQASLQDSETQRRRQMEELSAKQRYHAEYQQRHDTLIERKFKLENQLEKTQISIETAGNKLWEDYGMTYADARKAGVEIAYSEAAREVQKVRADIRELGTVNPNAIEDYARVKERVDDLRTQREDLKKAEEDLKKLIDELMGVMRTTFSEKFDQINENFQKIFRELFGGGRAQLSFEEGDIMECGIEIIAEPPGKRLKHISLLSGGERALTAIALLFAMIRINPSPVCLLDEIDAPLDEANVIRFSAYLQKITNTQFIIITHRKPTMTICGVLYGVAMEEKGVSKLVSVKLREREA